MNSDENDGGLKVYFKIEINRDSSWIEEGIQKNRSRLLLERMSLCSPLEGQFY